MLGAALLGAAPPRSACGAVAAGHWHAGLMRAASGSLARDATRPELIDGGDVQLGQAECGFGPGLTY